jgi:hypothetical protein
MRGNEMATNQPKYPDVYVQLSGTDGNTGNIMGAVTRALKRHGASQDEIAAMRAEMMSGDYDNVLRTAMRWVTVG